MSRKHSEYSGYSWVNINFRVVGEHAKLIADAAEARGLSLTAWLRPVVLEWAAAELGRDAPNMEQYSGDIVAAAAKKVNMSAADFIKQAARESAARILQPEGPTVVAKLSAELQERLNQIPEATANQSGERRRVAGRRN